MAEEQKPKRKYTRRQPKVEPMAVYNVLVTVKRGKKVETIYCEATRVENGCLVVVSMDGPQPLVEKTRYIPFGDAEITVCQRARPYYPTARERYEESGIVVARASGPVAQGDFVSAAPRFEPGPLERVRQMAPQPMPQQRPVPRQTADTVINNGDGAPVITAGFLDQ